jgi:hypothetical protein
MSLKNNKAARLNRYMMFGTLFLGILVIGCVFAFLYMAYNGGEGQSEGQGARGVGQEDSIVFIVNDSTLLEE